MKKILLLILLLSLTGCASRTTIEAEPYKKVEIRNTRIYGGSIDEVWHAAIRGLSKTFFVLDNIEKSSKIITLSFMVDDPEPYIDCGTMTVKTEGGATGQGIYSFPFARKSTTYTLSDGTPHAKLTTRTAGLSGKMNVVFTKLSKNNVQVSVNARFIMQGQVKGSRFVPIGFGGSFQPYTDAFSASCTTGQPSSDCTSTNKLEQLILDEIGQELIRNNNN